MGRCIQSGEAAVLVVLYVLPRSLWFSKKTLETQGMGTLVRRNAPNGEVPRPLRSFVSLWETGA